MPHLRLAALLGIGAALAFQPTRADVAVTIDLMPTVDRPAISPLIYGTNDDIPGVKFTLRRQGGNRLTGYNWENNASNAGNDYFHQSDDYLTWVVGIPSSQANTPGIVVTHFQDAALAAGTNATIVTLPMAGYVAADKAGVVSTAQAAPSARWVAVENNKPAALSLTPDLTDGKVYSDELINFLVNRYGPASSATGITAYSLDNEPDLWSNTHARLHPAKPLAAELVSRSVELAKTVKRVDPTAEVVGFVSYGFNGYLTFQDAPDWSTERAKGSYAWYLDYFLDQMKQASTAAGQRLLDVVDLHNYSEAIGGGYRINDSSYSDFTNIEWNKARMQAPRTYWDSTYRENSWIAQWNSSFLPLLPKFQQSIAKFYPGTKLAITEYNFGGEDHISGGIAEADALGAFGKNGVYMAALWPFSSNQHRYVAAAFNLYLDYDGAGHGFGDRVVSARTDDHATATIYASLDSAHPGQLHAILLNKSYDAPTTFNLSILEANYSRARVFAFDASSSSITDRGVITSTEGIHFNFSLPALTAAHLVFDNEPVILTQPVSQLSLHAGRPLQLTVKALGGPISYQWRKDGVALAGATSSTLTIANVTLADAGRYDCVLTGSTSTATTDATVVSVVESGFTQQPSDQTPEPGQTLSLTAAASGATAYAWQRNGGAITNATSASLAVANLQPLGTGLYSVTATTGSGTKTSDWVIVGLFSNEPIVGDGQSAGSNILHPNGNHFDQILLTGAAETLRASYFPTAPALSRVLRTSFIDLDDDIVQVELSGPGNLSLVLDDATGPALPANYNQDVTYMKGHAGIVITGADENTNLTIFTVGRATAFDSTNTYHFLEAPSATNDPAKNASPLFAGHEATHYDGIADLAFVAIASGNGRFGGVRAANAHFFAHAGPTGLYAPNIAFSGPVFVGNITAFDSATPVLMIGSSSDTRITGGDLFQDNSQSVRVSGLTRLQFTDGSDSAGHLLPATPNRGVLTDNGADVTNQVVVNPSP